jgi:hypothetical protein
MSTATKTRKQFILDQEKIDRVRKLVRAKSDTEAVARALDIIIENSRIESVLRSIKGKGRVKDLYGRTAA